VKIIWWKNLVKNLVKTIWWRPFGEDYLVENIWWGIFGGKIW
jgi:hypothetical protein